MSIDIDVANPSTPPVSGGRVAVVGSLNMDLSAQTKHLPQPGETVRATRFLSTPGGKGANQAVAAARLGGRVSMLGCVGDDAHGDILQTALMEEGVDCSALLISKEQPTGIAMIVVEKASQNTIVIVGGSNDEMQPSTVYENREVLEEADIVVCQLEIPLQTVRAALQVAREAGKVTVLNPAPVDDALPVDCYDLVDWLIPNELEASTLAGVPTRNNDEVAEAARILLERGTKNVLVTQGEKGVTWITRDTSGAVSVKFFAAKKVAAVDTTAAGDTFVGGFVAALSNGRSECEAIKLGQAAAAVAVIREGAQRSIPRLSEILEVDE